MTTDTPNLTDGAIVQLLESPYKHLPLGDPKHPPVPAQTAAFSSTILHDLIAALSSNQDLVQGLRALKPEQDPEDLLVQSLIARKDVDIKFVNSAVTAVRQNNSVRQADSALRGVLHVLKQGASDDAPVRVLPASGEELGALIGGSGPIDSTPLVNSLIRPFNYRDGAAPTTTLFIDHNASVTDGREVDLLDRLAQFGKSEGVAVMLGANPLSFGAGSFSEIEKLALDVIRNRFGFDKPKPQLAAFNALRQKEESRFVALVANDVLAYGLFGLENKAPEVGFYSESPREQPLYFSPVYFVAGRMHEALTRFGWSTFCVGPYWGGRVDGRPVIQIGDPSTIVAAAPEAKIDTNFGAVLNAAGIGYLHLHANNTTAEVLKLPSLFLPPQLTYPEAQANRAIGCAWNLVEGGCEIASVIRQTTFSQLGGPINFEVLQTPYRVVLNDCLLAEGTVVSPEEHRKRPLVSYVLILSQAADSADRIAVRLMLVGQVTLGGADIDLQLRKSLPAIDTGNTAG